MSRKSAPVRFGSIRVKPPLSFAGQKIGLLGGSFNPPHEAHRLITEIAHQRLGLDSVWWIVTPGNPLKSHDELSLLAYRLKLCGELASNPRIKITAFEKDLPSAYTAASLAHLKIRFPGVHFVWLMGADNLATFHLWQDWRMIAAELPIAVVDRPKWRLPALASRAAHVLARRRLPELYAPLLATLSPPAWTFLTSQLSPLSSTEIRNKQNQRNTRSGCSKGG